MDHPPARRKRVATLAVALGMTLGGLVCGSAHAHEGDPRVWRIDFPLAAQGQAWVVDEMGLLLEQPQRDFLWLCDDGLSLTAGLRAAAPVSADGRVWLTATRERLYRSEDAGCRFEPVVGPLADHFIGPVLPHPTRPEVVLAATASLAVVNDVFRTEDGGRTWRGAGLALPSPVRSMVRAPSAPATIYLSHGSGAARSTDGGARFEALAWQFEGAAPRMDEVRLLGVSPDDPHTVFAALELFPDGHLAVSRDGGATWRVLLTTPGDVPESLAAAPGGRLWLSGPFTGLWRSADGGVHWENLAPPGTLGCLAVHPQTGDLWGCLRGNPLPWVIGRSADAGATWQAALPAYSAIAGGLDCPAASPTGQICGAQCDPADRQCQGAADGGAPADRGPGEDGGEVSRARVGSGCRTIGTGRGDDWVFLCLLLLFRRDRRRRSAIQGS
ncbi:MAG: hypothetical protein KC613_04285 [Myxococcales bacterium]|nr:hypothetical protein [Myxococcales bacterium]MCB9521817.1 hypothetical protein [Myxococcales bacterium]